jgi:hypothetical protein
MADGTHQAIAAAMAGGVLRLLAMVRLDFDSETFAWHNGYGEVSYRGAVYLGTGTLGSVGGVSVAPGAQPNTLSVGLGGIDPELVKLLLNEPYLGRRAAYHVAVVGADFRIDPEFVVPMFAGTIDGIEGTIGRSAGFTVNIKSRLADWERSRNLKYTDADQQLLYQGDRGFEFVPQIAQKKLIWPRAKFLPDARES